MGAKKSKPEKIRGPELTPKKSHAKFPRLKNVQKALNGITRKIKFFKNQVWLYFIRRIQPARPGYAGTTTNLQIDLNTEKKSIIKSSRPLKKLAKFSHPKKSWNRKFQTPKNPSIIPVT